MSATPVSSVIYSSDDIEAHLIYLDRAHKMTSSDHLAKETQYSKSARMIRQLLEPLSEDESVAVENYRPLPQVTS